MIAGWSSLVARRLITLRSAVQIRPPQPKMSKNRSLIYLAGHNNLFDKIIENKRYEIVNIIKNIISDYKINDVLDIGTTKR